MKINRHSFEMNYLSDGNTRGTWPSSPDEFFSLLRSFLPPYHRMKEPSVRFYLPDYTIPRAGTKLWRRIIYQILLSRFTNPLSPARMGELFTGNLINSPPLSPPLASKKERSSLVQARADFRAPQDESLFL